MSCAPGLVAGKSPPQPERPWDLLTCVLTLARPHDSEEFGSQLGTRAVPFLPNSALVFLGASHGYVPIPESAPVDTERYTYEFGIGPTKEGRRTLAAMMNQDDGPISPSLA